jgi:radical SAM superfamily enzyme YgiQ (UPF0313 family)
MLKVKIVQQAVWHMSKESMPLAAGYLAAVIPADSLLSANCNVSIDNFSDDVTTVEMAVRLLSDGPPDVIGFSVLGWNIRQFAAVAETVKLANPHALVVFGGNHVSNQADGVFRHYDAVDIVVNGEGEFAFRDILHAQLGTHNYADIEGISYRDQDGSIATTPARPRIADLDVIPSPFLTGAIPLHDDSGAFRYDVALLETNRGCPYHCAFCYWGGAVGQKVRTFSRDRLRRELDMLASARAETVVLCDANFGMLPSDRDFVDDLIEVKRRTGFPKALETSWAKNKNAIFYDIVRKIRDAELQSSFTLALQTLTDDALTAMNRRNMKINEWRDLAQWLTAEGMNIYAELIWGAPGETPESFLRGYDELAKYVSRIAAYPLLLLPNTGYVEHRQRYGFVTVRGERDDFEYVLVSKDFSLHDNLKMQRFLFWARLLAENLMLRHIWPVLRAVGSLSQSTAILSIADYIEAQDHPTARLLAEAARSATADPDSLAPALEACFTEPEFDDLVLDWVRQRLLPGVTPEWRDVVSDVARFDLQTRPLPYPARRGFADAQPVVEDGIGYWQVDRVYAYDVPQVVRCARSGTLRIMPPRQQTPIRLRFRDGFAALARSTNHEETAHYVARTESRSAQPA